MSKAIIIAGNPVDGFTVNGPFRDSEQACDWADWKLEADWWLTELEEPEDLEEFDPPKSDILANYAQEEGLVVKEIETAPLNLADIVGFITGGDKQ